jgi:ParB-like chromosome segregation protein Spo0J
MHLIHKPLSELLPAPYNPRLALDDGDRRYRKLKRGIEQFGLVEPLVWNGTTGHLVGGHLRHRILQELGHSTVEVSVVTLALEAEKALNLLLNNREAQGDWNLNELTAVLAELDHLPDDALKNSGFDVSHLQVLQRELSPDPGASPEPAAEGICEITLCVPQSQLEAVRADLDVLLEKHQLTVHVKAR